MIEQSVSLASNGVVKVPGYEQLVRFGYTKNRGVYRLAVSATGEWEGLAIRCFWHVPDGKDPASSLVVDGYVGVPASVTAQPGNGCVTFEGSDGAKTVTSADLHYRVSANSGTEDGTEPEPGTPAWQQFVDAVHTDATAAEQAKTDAQTAASEAATSAGSAICQLGYQNAQLVNGLERSVSNGDNAINLAIMQEGNARQAGQTALATQLASCCCENKQLIGDLKYTIATEDCATRQAIADNARAIVDNCNANFRSMMDYFTQDKIATLTAENQSLKFAASQDRQNALLTTVMSQQTDTILNRVNPRPIPAYQVTNPNVGVNCCGCC